MRLEFLEFLGKWTLASFLAWFAGWTVVAFGMFMNDPFQSMDEIFPFPFGGITVLAAVIVGLFFADCINFKENKKGE